MLGVDQDHRFEEVLKWLAGLENGVKGEAERLFNESMADPRKWADPGFANMSGCSDEAEAHNAPIREARGREYAQRDAEREAKRTAEEQAAKEEYEQAIKTAESSLLNKQKVKNSIFLGNKSLIMQLFREHERAVPPKTQGSSIPCGMSITMRITDVGAITTALMAARLSLTIFYGCLRRFRPNSSLRK